MKMLSVVSKHKPLHVFIDLSLFTTPPEGCNFNQFMEMVGLLCGNENHRILISASSGIRHVTNCGKSIMEKLGNILKTCEPFYVTGFTEKEAKKYFTNNQVSFEDVYPFTGTNPYLLSSVNKVKPISLVEQTVSSKIKFYMSTNLGLEKDSDKLIDYFKTQELHDTLKFSYCACRRGQLDDTEEYQYQQTWLAKHHLAVVEDVRAKTLTVRDDQDETLTNEEGNEVDTKILRWNFPTFGSVYLDVLRNFINDCDSNKLKEICKKEPSFAGFWLEGMFVSHHKENSATISVKYTEIKSTEMGTAMEVKFEKISVAMLNPSTEVKLDVLYELKRAHPIVDFVGHLTGNDNNQWLMFIQISLQPYQQHRTKLGDIFRRTSENITNKSWSLYTGFRQLYSINYHDTSKKVLLLYISPKETKLEQLWSSVKDIHINQSVYVGVLASTATFYKDLMDFQKMRLN